MRERKSHDVQLKDWLTASPVGTGRTVSVGLYLNARVVLSV